MLTLFLACLASAGGAADSALSLASEATAPAAAVVQDEHLPVDLDQALEALRFGALLRMSLDVVDDELVPAGEDATGVRFEDAQLWFDTQAGPFDVFMMAKGADANAFPPVSDGSLGDFDIRDFWISTDIAEGAKIYGGQFKCPIVGSGMVPYDSLIMIDRTRIGQIFSADPAYQPGVAVTYDNDMFHGKVALQNGADSIIDEFGMVVRGEVKMNGGARHREGALGAPEDLAGTLGLGYFADDSQIGGDDFGSALAVDAYATFNQFSFFGEVLDMDEELAVNLTGMGAGFWTDEGTPWSATVGYLFGDSRWEAALRYQDMDDDLDTRLVGGGVNYYQNGHPLKYQLNVSDFDNDAADGVIAQFGVTLGLGAPNLGCATCRG